jgi:hypothetical protein
VKLCLDRPAAVLALHRLKREREIGRHPVKQRDLLLVKEPRLRRVGGQHGHAPVLDQQRERRRGAILPRQRRLAPRPIRASLPISVVNT